MSTPVKAFFSVFVVSVLMCAPNTAFAQHGGPGGGGGFHGGGGGFGGGGAFHGGGGGFHGGGSLRGGAYGRGYGYGAGRYGSSRMSARARGLGRRTRDSHGVREAIRRWPMAWFWAVGWRAQRASTGF
jgi:hypothetical protein